MHGVGIWLCRRIVVPLIDVWNSGKLMVHSINLIYDRIFSLSLPLDNTITVEIVFQFAFIDIFYFELDLLMLYDAT